MFSALLFPYILSNFFRSFMAIIAGDFARDLNCDAAALATLQAAFLMAFAVAQLPTGLALDRYGPRATLLYSLGSAVLGSMLLSLATRYELALVGMILLGAGFAPVLMTGFYLIARSYPADRFATMSSLLFGLGTLGDPLSGAPLAFAAEMFGWRSTMLAMSAATAAALVGIAVFVRDPPRLTAPEGPTTAVRSAIQILGLRALWPIFPLSLVTYAVVAATRGLWIAPYLESVHHFSPRAVSVSATAMGVAIAAGGLLYAPLNRAIGDAKLTVSVGVSITVVGWLLLAIIGDRSGWLAVSLLLLVAVFGATFAIVMTHARSFMPAHLLGQGATTMNLLFFVGASLVQWLSGRFVGGWQLAAVPAPEIYSRLFFGFALVLAAALMVYLFAPRERMVGSDGERD